YVKTALMARRTATRYIPVSPTLLSPRMLWAQLSAKTWTLWGNYVECAVRLAPLNRERQLQRSLDLSCPGLTRASIFIARKPLRRGWIATQLGLARVAHF